MMLELVYSNKNYQLYVPINTLSASGSKICLNGTYEVVLKAVVSSALKELAF